MTLFLNRFPVVKPADKSKKAWHFWQKAYPSLFTVRPAVTPEGKHVIVFYPKEDELADDLVPEAQEEDEPEEYKKLPKGQRTICATPICPPSGNGKRGCRRP